MPGRTDKAGSCIRVKLEKRAGTGLGFSIRSEKNGVVVASLLPGGVAQQSGLLMPGDVIERVNDIDVSRMAYDNALELLEAIPAGVPVVLLLATTPGKITHLRTTFSAGGVARTMRVSQPIGAPAGNDIEADASWTERNGSALHSRAICNSREALNVLDENDNAAQVRSAETGLKTEEPCGKKYEKLRFLLEDKVYTDTLHLKATDEIGCSRNHCMGSMLAPVTTPTTVRPREEVLRQAKDFIDQYYTSIKRVNTPAHTKRTSEVVDEIEASGTYLLTSPELTFGAKTAWRNAARCIGRIQWSKLQVFDARHITTTRSMFDAICNHLKYATNKGNIRSAVTVFPVRTEPSRDFRVWNSQLISYAAYRQDDETVIGDKITLEFTEMCQRLGWEGSGGEFDVLPLVLQAEGGDPDYYELAPDLVLDVKIKHPDYPWFEELGLRWYATPAVANMMLDLGGLQFPAVPFNGWYMETEVGARDLCDPTRYGKLEVVADMLGLDTSRNSSLWRDQALVVVNQAVLHSYQTAGVTITDHHTASETFMKHYDTEMKVRGGCPADWVWIVPPISGSVNPVFHLEMLNYKLKPSFEYQADPWKTYVWKNKATMSPSVKRPKPKISFKELARAVRLTAKLMGSALANRVKCVILYASETGRSESYAKKLCDMFAHAFDARMCCMEDYNCLELEHETLVLVVTSTSGNGDPPDNGAEFSRTLYEMVPMERQKKTMRSLKHHTLNDRTDSVVGVGSTEEPPPDVDGPLANVRYSVFALGSTAYPNFCAFGRYMDGLLAELGAERIAARGEGDELGGQDKSFNEWAQTVFKVASSLIIAENGGEYIEQES